MPSLWVCAFLKWAEAVKVLPGMSAEARLRGLGRGKGVVKVSCNDIAVGVLSVCCKRLSGEACDASDPALQHIKQCLGTSILQTRSLVHSVTTKSSHNARAQALDSRTLLAQRR